MPAANKLIMIGNLTADPQLSYTSSQTAVADVGLAVNRKRGSGEQAVDDTCFIDLRAFGKTAESLVRYCHKGALIYAEGYLSFEKWQGKNDHKPHSRHRFITERIQFLTPKSQGREPGDTE